MVIEPAIQPEVWPCGQAVARSSLVYRALDSTPGRGSVHDFIDHELGEADPLRSLASPAGTWAVPACDEATATSHVRRVTASVPGEYTAKSAGLY